jgi:hypothetical protein
VLGILHLGLLGASSHGPECFAFSLLDLGRVSTPAALEIEVFSDGVVQ